MLAFKRSACNKPWWWEYWKGTSRKVWNSIFICLKRAHWLPSHPKTLLAEPRYREGGPIALAQEVVPSAANPIQLTSRFWLRAGAATVGHLCPFPCRRLPEDSEERGSTSKGVTRGPGTEGAALCQEKGPADGPDLLRGWGGRAHDPVFIPRVPEILGCSVL